MMSFMALSVRDNYSMMSAASYSFIHRHRLSQRGTCTISNVRCVLPTARISCGSLKVNFLVSVVDYF